MTHHTTLPLIAMSIAATVPTLAGAAIPAPNITRGTANVPAHSVFLGSVKTGLRGTMLLTTTKTGDRVLVSPSFWAGARSKRCHNHPDAQGIMGDGDLGPGPSLQLKQDGSFSGAGHAAVQHRDGNGKVVAVNKYSWTVRGRFNANGTRAEGTLSIRAKGYLAGGLKVGDCTVTNSPYYATYRTVTPWGQPSN